MRKELLHYFFITPLMVQYLRLFFTHFFTVYMYNYTRNPDTQFYTHTRKHTRTHARAHLFFEITILLLSIKRNAKIIDNLD